MKLVKKTRKERKCYECKSLINKERFIRSKKHSTWRKTSFGQTETFDGMIY